MGSAAGGGEAAACRAWWVRGGSSPLVCSGARAGLTAEEAEDQGNQGACARSDCQRVSLASPEPGKPVIPRLRGKTHRERLPCSRLEEPDLGAAQATVPLHPHLPRGRERRPSSSSLGDPGLCRCPVGSGLQSLTGDQAPPGTSRRRPASQAVWSSQLLELRSRRVQQQPLTVPRRYKTRDVVGLCRRGFEGCAGNLTWKPAVRPGSPEPVLK